MVQVSWLNALAYVQWLAQVSGQPWRLPTEAEWEKAARGTDGRIYPWGNQWDNTRANAFDGGPHGGRVLGAYASHSDASPYGCHDMAGNVWQWCSSIYRDDAYQPDSNHENNGDITGDRVLRGGSWYNDPQYARAACRNWYAPDILLNYWGFRVARAGRASSH